MAVSKFFFSIVAGERSAENRALGSVTCTMGLESVLQVPRTRDARN